MYTRKLILIAFMALISSFSNAQKSAPPNWFNLDQKADKIPGVSTERAYNELLKGKTSKTVVVAVIDGGTEVNHEDLKEVIWINKNEIAGNGIDDDKNGYIDDVNGWSFIGGKDTNVVEDSYELTRVYTMYKKKYASTDPLKIDQQSKADYEIYLSVKKEYESKYSEQKKMLEVYETIKNVIDKVIKQTGTDKPTEKQLANIKFENPMENQFLTMIKGFAKKGTSLKSLAEELDGPINYFAKGVKFGYNTEFNPRVLIGDNYEDVNERFYGSNYVSGPKGEHGTHVAGIIAAMRTNNIGMKGVADNVRIMVLRVVPDGDERDKDVANAIRYAADNGASIINMSFGKSHSPYKTAVDEAIKYAQSKDVLMIHAAGNDSKNTDTLPNYPTDKFNDGKESDSWIEVGASNWKGGKYIAASFSNFGASNVDVFAPGVDIYSCVPFSAYDTYNGTSMAAPVTAGVAAIIRSYYPQFSASEVKHILTASAIPVNGNVIIPGAKAGKKKLFFFGGKAKTSSMKSLCRTGGIVNVYTAVKMAEAKSKK